MSGGQFEFRFHLPTRTYDPTPRGPSVRAGEIDGRKQSGYLTRVLCYRPVTHRLSGAAVRCPPAQNGLQSTRAFDNLNVERRFIRFRLPVCRCAPCGPSFTAGELTESRHTLTLAVFFYCSFY